MGIINFLYNTTTAGASIKATAQQLTLTGLGNFWQESSGTFVTTAVAFASRSYDVTEQLPVGDSSVAYFGSTPGAALTYTGPLIIGYHDTADSNKLLFSEIRYFQSGEDVSFTISQDRANTPVPDSFVFTMSRRSDGSVVSKNNLYLSDVDVVDFGFDVSSLLSPGVVVSTISNIVVAPSGALVVTSVGPRDQMVILRTNGAQVASVTYTVTCTVLTSDSTTLELNGSIVTATTP